MILGFSTGCTYRIAPKLLQQVEMVKQTGCNAIEISVVRKQRLEDLDLVEDLDFDYISCHAPANIKYKDNEDTRKVLESIERNHKRLDFRTVAVHPDTVEDWDIFKEFDVPWAMENMDDRKDFGKTVEEMKVIEEHDFKMVLDLNHVYTLDKSMGLANEFIRNFGDRISEIHLSGISDEEVHLPLFMTRQEEIMKAVPADIPIILEGTFTDNKLSDELNYVRKFFKEGER